MVKLHCLTSSFLEDCIVRYERESPGDIFRVFDPPLNSEHYRVPSVLVWNPLVESETKVYCPISDHRSCALRATNAWSHSVQENRNDSTPFFLYDIGRNIVVVSALLECIECREPYVAHHQHILSQLKFAVPFHRSYKVGVTSGLYDLIIKSIEEGMFFKSIERMLHKLLESRYGSQPIEEQLILKSLNRKDITKIFMNNYEEKKAFYEKTMRNIRSYEISTDNTFKSIKGVTVKDDKRKIKQFGSICLVLNQDGLIVGKKSVSGASLTEAKAVFENLRDNNRNITRIDTGKYVLGY